VADFKMSSARVPALLDRAPFNKWASPDGPPFLEFHRLPNGYLLRFPENADFEVTSGTLDVVCHPAPGVPFATCEHLYLNQVGPLVLAAKGQRVLHGSAVAAGGAALAFVAQAGRGKSTLAAAFAIAGCPFLTDDGLLLEPEGDVYKAFPSHPSIRLWEDSQEMLLAAGAGAMPPVHYTAKSRFAANSQLGHCSHPMLLGGIYFLGPGDAADTEIRPVAGAEAVANLLQHSFILDIEDRAWIGAHFSRLAAIADSVGCFHLDYPRCYEDLPSVLKAIRAHAASEGRHL
jgi:hypothetical protein